MRNFIVFDLDGTLADDKHRKFHLKKEPKDWDSWHRDCIHDTPVKPLAELTQGLMFANTMIGDTDFRVEIWTGRGDQVRAETVEWLKTHSIWYHDLRMRPVGDHRADTDLKLEWYNNSEFKPNIVFEDRARMVKMWRGLGVICCQVAEGDF